MARTAKPKPLVLDPTILLEDVALDNEHVIVAASQLDAPRLFIVNYDGTGRRDLVPASAPQVARIAADAAGIFTSGDAGICRVDKSGAVTQLANVRSWAIALDDEFVYGSVMGSYPDYKDGGVVRIPRAGGDVEWIVMGRMCSALGIDSGLVYFASGSSLCCRDDGGNIHTMTNVKNPHAIVGIDGGVAWTEFDNDGAPRCLRNREVRTLAAQSYTSDMHVLGDWLYWTQSTRKKSDSAIWRMRVGDAEPESLAKFSGKAPRVAVNERLLCWIGDGRGGVYALAS